jgi:hypothetical protein
MAPAELRELRRVLRYCNLLVRTAITMKTRFLVSDGGWRYLQQATVARKELPLTSERVEEVPESVSACYE